MTTSTVISPATPIRRRGSVDVLGTISSLLAGYSGGITIVRELAQNTDDVPGDGERWLELHFHDDRLIVRNNTVFRTIDFDNIMHIARGGKKQEQRRTIGAFGVGFVSVYQLTDTPIVRSADRELRMMPGVDDFPIDDYPCEHVDYTEFTLPYRRKPTAVGNSLGMPHVTETWVDEVLRELPDETYRLLFFLRRLSRIAVFQNGELISEVSREVSSDAAGFDRIALTSRQGSGAPQTHTWLRFSGQVSGNAPLRPDGQPAKDRTVHIVVPDSDVPDTILRERLAGRLYNYLPTEIATGLPFQINGDFYPTTDRKGIDNGHLNSKEWNSRVLGAIGGCVAAALPKLLARFVDTPLQLYHRINIGQASDLVAPITTALINAARSLAIFKTSDGWRDRISTRWIKSGLRAIAEEMSPALMPRDLQEAASTLITKLDVREFTFTDMLAVIRREVQPGTVLAEAPSYLRTIMQVEALYTALDSGLAQGLETLVRQTPIFLDHTGRLWPADACVRSTQEELRKDLVESGLHFWNFDRERYRLAASMVAPFKLDHLWDVLRRQLPAEVTLADAPEWLNSPTKLYRLYRTIIRTREPVLKSAVAGLPICLSRETRLCRPDRLLLPDRDRILYELLADDPGTPLVAQPIYDDKSFRGLYSDMGVPAFALDDLFDRLSKLAREELDLTDAHPCLNNREKLLRLYRHLRDNRAELESKHIEALRHRLPIWLCRDGFLRRAKDRALPPDVTNLPGFIHVDHVLDLDGNEQLRTFLAEVVQLRPLGVEQFIIQALVPQFPGLERKYQIEALRFIRDHAITTVRNNVTLLETLKQTRLIFGDDDHLHRPIDLCFPRATCRMLFPDRFNEPSGFYAPPTGGDFSGWIWYDLFKLLGINHLAPPTVVLEEIRYIVARPPRQGRDQIEKIFRYIEDNWEFYRSTSLIRNLRDIGWLPADGDETRWYRPCELYPRQDKPLIDRVARVISFGESRVRTFIAEAFGFPTTVPVEKVVQQLLILSERNEPASKYIYQALGRTSVTTQQLKPLLGHAIIYDERNQRYWKPEQIFLSNQRKHFGSYRGYAPNSEFRTLFEQLGAREEPVFKDFVLLLQEVSSAYREALPDEEAVLARNAYERLADAPEVLVSALRSLPCVLTTWRVENRETFALRLPESVLLTPAEQYRQLMLDLPIALYTPSGEATLRALGVRTIEQVLTIDHLLQPNLSHSVELAHYFAPLERPIRRLLFHHNRSLENDLPAVVQRLSQLRGYWQDGIQVVYRVQLGRETYASQPTKRNVFYFAEQDHIYLDRRLTEVTLPRELARVLGEVLNLRDGHHSLLKELIADPRGAAIILDDNNIKPLPQDLDLVDIDEAIEEISVGAQHDDELSVEPAVPIVKDPSEINTEAGQQNFDDLFDNNTRTRRETTTRSDAISGATADTSHRNNQPIKGIDPATPGKDGGNGAKSPGSGGASRASGNGTGTNKPSSPLPQRPKPQPDPTAPMFTGTVVSSSPAIPTDYDGLRERVRRWAEATGQPLTGKSVPPPPPPHLAQPRRPEPAEQRNVARFVLSFPEVRDGFLRLATAQARNLFHGSPTRIECRTDAGKIFPLWLEWQRDVPIAHNQEALGAFFTDEVIPAGGIIYLQREHDETFRIFYNHVPHSVPEVRIAFNDQGEVRYEIHDTEVTCETDDAIYRAERRFEDQPALWLEAVGKKSVEEMLCDLLMSSPDGWRHEDELKAMVAAVRMVADSTVPQTLRAKGFFEHDGEGNWRLDPAQLLAHVRDDAVARWQRSTTRLLRSDDQVLGEALPLLRPPLNELTGRLIRIEAAITPQTTIEEDEFMFVQQLNADPDNHMLRATVIRVIQQRATTGDIDLSLDTRLRAAFNAASEEIWSNILRTTLHDLLTRFQYAHDYQRALALARSWSDYDLRHGLDLAEMEAEAQAAHLIAGSPPALEAVLQAISLAPNFALVREKLHLASQAALRQHEPTIFLAHGAAECAVQAFFAHIADVAVARKKLERAKVPAFDRTVLEEARRLWPYLSEPAQLRLLLWLPRFIDSQAIRLTNAELELLLHAAERHIGQPVGLLIGAAAWKLCPAGHPIQQRIADQLAQCHIKMQIWEKANNRPWKQHVSEALSQELRKGWQQNNATLVVRERRLLDLLCAVDPSPLGETLETERVELYRQFEREYQLLLESAA
jgi:hypothetical protein